jgi:peptidyl-tRNA hydrolase
MKIICYYNRTLKLTEGKLASQIGHVTKELGRKIPSDFGEDIIVVLKLTNAKFKEQLEIVKATYIHHHIQVDKGMSEVPEGTITSFGYISDVGI